MIKVEHLNKVYDSGKNKVVALTDISFTIANSEFVSIIGPSGCGKSTLLKIIGDLVEPTEGVITVNGQPPRDARMSGAFSFVFQNPVLLPWRDIISNVQLPLEILHGSARTPKELLHMVGLKDFERKYPHELSGGMQQRVALARALTFDPKVLLMDEPFASLDEFTRNDLNDQLTQIWKQTNVTALLVTHSISEALYLSDRIMVLSKRPARIQEFVTVPFPRPRNREIKETKEFQDQIKWLRKKLE